MRNQLRSFLNSDNIFVCLINHDSNNKCGKWELKILLFLGESFSTEVLACKLQGCNFPYAHHFYRWFFCTFVSCCVQATRIQECNCYSNFEHTKSGSTSVGSIMKRIRLLTGKKNKQKDQSTHCCVPRLPVLLAPLSCGSSIYDWKLPRQSSHTKYWLCLGNFHVNSVF